MKAALVMPMWGVVRPRGRGGCGALVVVVPVVVGEVPGLCVGDFGDGGGGGVRGGDGFVGRVGGDGSVEGEVIGGAGIAAGGGVDEGGGIVAEQGVGPAGELEVVGDVAAGLLAGHGGHGVAQGDALLQGGEDGELHGAPQGGLADEQAGQGRVGVEVVVGEHPYGLELLVAQQVGLVDDQDGGFAALVAFGGQDGGGLGGEPRAAAVGLGAGGGDDHLVQAADADHRVGQVDAGVPGRVQAGQDGADRGGLAGPDFTSDDADRAFGDAPGDAGDGLVVRGVAVPHARGHVPAAPAP